MVYFGSLMVNILEIESHGSITSYSFKRRTLLKEGWSRGAGLVERSFSNVTAG